MPSSNSIHIYLPRTFRRQGSNVNAHAGPPMGTRPYRANFDGAAESGCKTVAVLNAEYSFRSPFTCYLSRINLAKPLSSEQRNTT